MTILDKLSEFCDATAVNQDTTATMIGSAIDLKAIGIDVAAGEPIWLVIRATTEITTSGSAGTIKFELRSDSTAAVHPTTGTLHYTTATFVNDDTAANSTNLHVNGAYGMTRPPIAAIRLPSDIYEQFLGIICVPATTAPNAGAIDAYLTKTYPRNLMYPNAI